jgi:hypothetical protein
MCHVLRVRTLSQNPTALIRHTLLQLEFLFNNIISLDSRHVAAGGSTTELKRLVKGGRVSRAIRTLLTTTGVAA